MKKIINRKVYDTDTAKFLGENSHGKYGDLDYYEEALYLKKTGEYFLYGTGNANTKYSEPCGDGNWSGSSRIQLMSLDSAKDWAEENLTVDEYEEAFGGIEEDGETKVPLTISISKKCKDTLVKLREESGGTKSISQLIEEKFVE